MHSLTNHKIVMVESIMSNDKPDVMKLSPDSQDFVSMGKKAPDSSIAISVPMMVSSQDV